MTPNDVIAQVKYLIQDNQLLRTTEEYITATLLGFVNQALKRMAYYRPDLFTTIGEIPLTQNTVVQTLPAGAVRLVELFSVKDGSALTEVNRELLDQSVPTWVSDTAGTPVNYARHVRNPLKFFVYPRPTAGVILIGEYATSPTKYTNASSTITELPDNYLPSLIDCVTFLAESIDSADNTQANADRARLFYDSFTASLGVTIQTRTLTDNEDSGLTLQDGNTKPQRRVT